MFLFLGFFAIGICGAVLYKSLFTSPMVSSSVKTFSLAKAPSDSLSSSVISLSGDVTWESRIATAAVKLKNTQMLQQGESVSTEKNGTASLAFFQRVLLRLSPNTTISYIQTLPIDIVIEQNTGKALYTTTGLSPLSVRVLNLLVYDTKPSTYAITFSSPMVTVQLTSGYLTLAYTNADNTSAVIPVKTGQEILFDDTTGEIVFE